MRLDYIIDNELLELEDSAKTVEVYDYSNENMELEEGINTNKIFNGYVNKADSNGDLTVSYNGVNCYLKIEDFTALNATIVRFLAQNKVGKNISFRVKEIKDNKIYIERKSIIENIREKYSGLKEGNNVYGVVTGIDQQRGAFVDIGGDIQAIIPKSMIENVFVSEVADHIFIGEKVYAKVVEIDRDEKGEITHLALNRKVLLPSFDELTKDINTYDVMIAKVKTVNPNGIHCSLNAHLDIFCGFVPGLKVEKGDKVRVLVKQIRPERQRINGNILGII